MVLFLFPVKAKHFSQNELVQSHFVEHMLPPISTFFYKLKTVQSGNMNTLKCLHNLRKLMKEVTEVKNQTKTDLQNGLFSQCCCIKK